MSDFEKTALGKNIFVRMDYGMLVVTSETAAGAVGSAIWLNQEQFQNLVKFAVANFSPSPK